MASSRCSSIDKFARKFYKKNIITWLNFVFVPLKLYLTAVKPNIASALMATNDTHWRFQFNHYVQTSNLYLLFKFWNWRSIPTRCLSCIAGYRWGFIASFVISVRHISPVHDGTYVVYSGMLTWESTADRQWYRSKMNGKIQMCDLGRYSFMTMPWGLLYNPNAWKKELKKKK